jgi:hypothetical protein
MTRTTRPAPSSPDLESPAITLAESSAQKRRVARDSVLAAGAMTLLKLAAGLLSGSLGVLSDAAHSGLDLVGAALTFFSVQVSDKPADEDHTYGHGKIRKPLRVLRGHSDGRLLRVDHLGSDRSDLLPLRGIAPLVVAGAGAGHFHRRGLLAIAAIARGGLRTGSPALATDAFHFASDIWATSPCWPGWAPVG